MKKFNLIFFLIFFFLLNGNANSKIVFIDIDFLIKNTIIGKATIEKLEKVQKDNNSLLKNEEDMLKIKEEEIISKKNILSSDEYKKEVNSFKIEVNKYNKKKINISENFNKEKIQQMNIILSKFNEVITEYIDANSIEIVLSKKSLYIGKNSSDITKIILEEVNKKFK